MTKYMTKDESYLVKLFQMASKSGDPYKPMSRYEVGRALGHGDKSVDGIIRMLAQTNFVKKGEGDIISLTLNGLRLVESLISL